jgi:hypothetical protein
MIMLVEKVIEMHQEITTKVALNPVNIQRMIVLRKSMKIKLKRKMIKLKFIGSEKELELELYLKR